MFYHKQSGAPVSRQYSPFLLSKVYCFLSFFFISLSFLGVAARDEWEWGWREEMNMIGDFHFLLFSLSF